MPKSRLSKEARALATAIRAIRPNVITGSNVIPVDAERTTYYALVNAAAGHLWPVNKAADNAAASEFFDLCGIPD